MENGDLPNGSVSIYQLNLQKKNAFQYDINYHKFQLKDSKSSSKTNEPVKGTNNNDDTSELGELSSDCGHPTGCMTLKTRILPKLRLGRR